MCIGQLWTNLDNFGTPPGTPLGAPFGAPLETPTQGYPPGIRQDPPGTPLSIPGNFLDPLEPLGISLVVTYPLLGPMPGSPGTPWAT